MISRKPLSDLLVETLGAATGLAVGDAHTPDPGTFGWSGTPGSVDATYTPYNVLIPMSAGRPSGPLSDSHADWQMPYQIETYGTTRAQVEWLSDLARSGLLDLRGSDVDCVDGTYRIQQIRVESIGAVRRVDALEPHTFGQTDMITVWVTKGI